eukprot:982321-Amphidinium_carterae.1
MAHPMVSRRSLPRELIVNASNQPHTQCDRMNAARTAVTVLKTKFILTDATPTNSTQFTITQPTPDCKQANPPPKMDAEAAAPTGTWLASPVWVVFPPNLANPSPPTL